jgi:hypothetical protein
MSLLEYEYFVITLVKKARGLKEIPYKIRPMGGTRAPPPSVLGWEAPAFQMEPESLPEASEPAFDPQDRADADRIINAPVPRRRQTFEALDEDGLKIAYAKNRLPQKSPTAKFRLPPKITYRQNHLPQKSPTAKSPTAKITDRKITYRKNSPTAKITYRQK